MKIEEVFEYVERIDFEFKIDHASSFDGFVSILEQDSVFEQLLAEAADSTIAQAVADRIGALLKVDADPQFAHPHDVSIAVYMLALIETHPTIIKPLLTEGPPVSGLFWARYAARSLQDKG